MQPISGINSRALNPLAPLDRKGSEDIKRAGEEAKKDPSKPVVDEYTPEKKPESAGQYWMGRDKDGSPKIYFDDPKKSSGPDKDSGAEGPQRSGGRKPETCVGNTDDVDREIRQLKKKQEELKQQLNFEQDPAKAEALKKQLSQVEQELRQKDNDTYRKAHSKFTQIA